MVRDDLLVNKVKLYVVGRGGGGCEELGISAEHHRAEDVMAARKTR